MPFHYVYCASIAAYVQSVFLPRRSPHARRPSNLIYAARSPGVRRRGQITPETTNMGPRGRRPLCRSHRQYVAYPSVGGWVWLPFSLPGYSSGLLLSFQGPMRSKPASSADQQHGSTGKARVPKYRRVTPSIGLFSAQFWLLAVFARYLARFVRLNRLAAMPTGPAGAARGCYLPTLPTMENRDEKELECLGVCLRCFGAAHAGPGRTAGRRSRTVRGALARRDGRRPIADRRGG